jgi:hypothetical protein
MPRVELLSTGKRWVTTAQKARHQRHTQKIILWDGGSEAQRESVGFRRFSHGRWPWPSRPLTVPATPADWRPQAPATDRSGVAGARSAGRGLRATPAPGPSGWPGTPRPRTRTAARAIRRGRTAATDGHEGRSSVAWRHSRAGQRWRRARPNPPGIRRSRPHRNAPRSPVSETASLRARPCLLRRPRGGKVAERRTRAGR